VVAGWLEVSELLAQQLGLGVRLVDDLGVAGELDRGVVAGRHPFSSGPPALARQVLGM